MNLPKKTLLIFVSGDGWSEHARIKPFAPDENVDVAFAFWGKSIPSDPMWKSAKYIFKKKGMKFHILLEMFENYPEMLTDYDAIFTFDDDVYMSKEAILDFLNIFYLFDFGLAAPGFYKNATNPVLNRKNGFVFRTTNTIEITAWCMSRKAAAATMPLIKTSDFGHGWGIPEWWMYIYHNGGGISVDGEKIGIIDISPAEHTRLAGVQYKALADNHGDLDIEKKNQQLRHIGREVPSWHKKIKTYQNMSTKSFLSAIKILNK